MLAWHCDGVSLPRVKFYARITLPFLLIAAYACGDDDTMGYKPAVTSSGQDATVTTDTGTTPATDTGPAKTDSATTTDSGTSTADSATADAASSPCTAANTFAVTNSGSAAYLFSRNGAATASNPALTLLVGEIYCFNLNVVGHPFWLKTVQGTGTANGIPGVANNGAETGTVILRAAAAGTFFYNCSQPHPAMTNTITITNP